jgi:8-oxo-dGTP diphosphatase
MFLNNETKTMSKVEYINSISIDCVLFGFENGELKVLLIKRKEEPFPGYWALPGGFVEPTEDIDNAAQRILYELTGMKNIYMSQLYTFGEVGRYPLGRVISIAYTMLVKISDYHPIPTINIEDLSWHPASDIKNLAFDHAGIVNKGLQQLRARANFYPVGFDLFPERFTISMLQSLYESIYQKKYDKRNFRKKIAEMDFIIKLEESQKGVAHRSARYYKFDQVRYEQLIAEGNSFKL